MGKEGERVKRVKTAKAAKGGKKEREKRKSQNHNKQTQQRQSHSLSLLFSSFTSDSIDFLQVFNQIKRRPCQQVLPVNARSVLFFLLTLIPLLSSRPTHCPFTPSFPPSSLVFYLSTPTVSLTLFLFGLFILHLKNG